MQHAFPDAILSWMNDFAPYGVVTTDTSFRVKTWNHWMTAHTGKAAADVVDRNLFELFPELSQRRFMPSFERALLGESSLLSTALHGYLFRMDSPVREAGFKEMQQTGRIGPLLYEKQIVGTIVVVEDVTQRELQASILRHQHERDTILSWALAHLLESPQPRRGIRELFLKIAEYFDWEAYLLYLFTADGQSLKLTAAGGITPESENAFSILSARDPLGSALLAARLDDDARRTVSRAPDEALQQLGFSVSTVLPLRSSEGHIGLLCFGARTRDSLREGELELLSTIGKYLSISIHKEATRQQLEAAKTKLNGYAENLERQVAERTAELIEIIGELERFSYTLAHDLRAPIRALTGYTEILEEDFASALPDEAQSIVRRLKRACKQLDDLTLDLLEFSKVSRGDLSVGPVDLETIVDDALSLIPSANASVTVQRPLHNVLANRALLQQSILNLLDNAVKFAKQAEPANIRIWTEPVVSSEGAGDVVSNAFSPARRLGPASPPAGAPEPSSNERIRIVVQDNGIGIPPELHRKVFGIFERGTSSEKYEGSGIGLAIVARAMQRMGGTCGVESVPNVGSRFWLELCPA